MIAPAILILLLVGLFPLIYSLVVSFQNITMTDVDTSFAGLLNYKQLFKDLRLWQALGHTVLITVDRAAARADLRISARAALS